MSNTFSKNEILNKAENASADPVTAMQDMMASIDTLRGIYIEETAALNAADTNAFFGIQERKIRAAQDYHAEITGLVARKDELLNVHPELKSLVRKKQEEFSHVTRENLDALNRMRRTMDRLGRRLTQAACDAAKSESVAYGSGGHLSTQRGKPVTVGINESA